MKLCSKSSYQVTILQQVQYWTNWYEIIAEYKLSNYVFSERKCNETIFSNTEN